VGDGVKLAWPHLLDGRQAWWPWVVVAALLFLCAAHGLWVVRGLTYPQDVDSLRDIGFAQSILDGDLFGDAVSIGEVRWYPPLMPALAAIISRLLGISDLPAFLIEAAPWINLLVPAAFFMAARQLLASSASAAAALASFVLLDGAVGWPWVTGGYTPWPLTPLITESLFFLTLWLILARQNSDRWLDAALIGAAIGVTFLAHPVPAIILTFIVTALAFGVRSFKVKTISWLALVAVVQLAVMSPYLAPIALHYSPRHCPFKAGLVDRFNDEPLRWFDGAYCTSERAGRARLGRYRVPVPPRHSSRARCGHCFGNLGHTVLCVLGPPLRL
jgi:hypothetical protein